MLLADRGIVCIDFDERSVRIVDAVVSRGRVRIRQAVHVAMGPAVNIREPASLGEFLRRTLAEHRIRSRRVVVDVPRQDAVFNLLTLPDSSLDELAAMVHIQIGKELPFSKDQAAVDFAVSREAGASTCGVWVAAVRTNVIDRYQQIFTDAGLKLERIGLRPYANLAALTADEAVVGRTLFVDIGPSMTEIDVIRDGHLAYSRAASVTVPDEGLAAPPVQPPPQVRLPGDISIPLADETIPKPRPMDSLLVEVSRTIEAYRATDPGARIDRIVLAGTCRLDTAITQAFEERFGAPARVFEPPASLRWKAAKDTSAAPFSSVLGLAAGNIRDVATNFDFIHPKEPEAGRRERVKRMPRIAAVIVLFVAAGSVMAYRPVGERNKRLAALDAEIARLNKGKSDREELLKQLGDVRSWNAQNVVWADQLKRLGEVFPSNKDCFITKLNFKDPGMVVIELAAVNEKIVTEQLIPKIESITDKNGQVFEAIPGDPTLNKKDNTYRFTDHVTVQLRALMPKPTSRRSSR